MRQAADFEVIDGLIVRGKKKEEEIELLENLQKSKLKTSLSEMELFVKNERNFMYSCTHQILFVFT